MKLLILSIFNPTYWNSYQRYIVLTIYLTYMMEKPWYTDTLAVRGDFHLWYSILPSSRDIYKTKMLCATLTFSWKLIAYSVFFLSSPSPGLSSSLLTCLSPSFSTSRQFVLVYAYLLTSKWVPLKLTSFPDLHPTN